MRDLDAILAEHKLRRREFLRKAVLAPTVVGATGVLANLLWTGAAWGQVTVPLTTILTTVPITTLLTTVPVTTLFTTFPVTTLFTTVATTFPFTTTVSSPATTVVFTTFPPFTGTEPVIDTSAPNSVPEPSSLALIATGVAAALALNARYRALAERIAGGEGGAVEEASRDERPTHDAPK